MADPVLDVAIEAVQDRASLARISAQWEDLVSQALDPDPLHDPALTLALLQAGGEDGFSFCLSWARDPERSDLPASLGALFAVRRKRSAWGVASWILCAPLVRADGAQRHLAALLGWLKRGGATLVEFRDVPREGRLNHVLAEVLREHDVKVYACDLPAPSGGDSRGLRNVAIGLDTLGELSVSMLALVDRAKRRIGARSRNEAPPVAA